MLKKIIRHGFNFLSFAFNFNPIIAIKLVVYPVIRRNKPIYDRNAYKHKVIKQYLKKKYRKIIKSFEGKTNKVETPFADNYPIWFMWWQGEENMPPVVKTCYQTIKRYSNGHNVNLVTKDNYRDFVTIPTYIIKKVEKNVFSLTLFSDILRICLLYDHGGLWLDSTVLLTKQLPSLPEICKSLGFWTPKDNGEIITLCFGAKNWIVREGKWLAFCLYSNKNNILIEFVRAMFFTYTMTNKILIDYFIIDYFISIAYETFPEIHVMIDSVPENNPKVHEIYHLLNLNNEYNKLKFDDICDNTVFHKLNWKEEHKQYTENGKLTNYGYILNNFPPNS
jgi:hypothetical protein